MSTLISEGFPVDRPVFEPPDVDRANEKPRYLVFMGSLVDADIIRSRPWTRFGGLEATNPCLTVVHNFLQRGRIVPLLRDKHPYLPYDFVKKTTEIDPLSAGYIGQNIPRNYVPPALPPANGQMTHGFGGNLAVGGPSPYGNMVARLAFPGEQIDAILRGDGSPNIAMNNVERGARELKSLAGVDYSPELIDGIYVDRAIWAMQRAIFPDFPLFLNEEGEQTVLLDDFEEILDKATIHTSLRAVVDEMQESVNQFRDYANGVIEQTHAYMRESASRGGYIYRYTSMDLILLEQLGKERMDREIRKAAKEKPNAALEDMFQQWLAIQIEEKQANIDRLKRVDGASQVDQNTMAAAPIEPPLAAEFPCPDCDKVFPSEAAMKQHHTRWCKGKEEPGA